MGVDLARRLTKGLGRPKVRREDLPQEAPKALEPEAQKRFLRAMERCTSVRDRALALLLFYTALRIGECASLDAEDVALSARKGKVIVRAGKGDTYREVALNAEAREALSAWLTERRQAVSHLTRHWRRWGRPNSRVTRCHLVA